MIPPLIAAASQFEKLARENGWSFGFVGGLIVGVWGEPRTTVDFDVVVFADFGSEETVIDPVLDRFRSRIEDARAFAARYRLIKIVTEEGVPGDVALGALPFEESMLSRVKPASFGSGVSLSVITAEDLFVMKAFASRPRDLSDLEGILVRSGKRMDMAYVRLWLHELLEGTERLDEMDGIERIISKRLPKS